MSRGVVLMLLVLVAFQLNFAEETEEENENTVAERSKRAVQTAQKTFKKLKSSFIKLGTDGAPGRPGAKGKPGVASQSGRPGARPRRPGPKHSSDPSKIDIVFVLDKSGSIGRQDFELEKKFVSRLIEFFPIFPAKTRVAIVTYSTTVKLEFNFNKYINRECLRKGIQGIKYTGGWTATGTALRYVKNNLIFNIGAGARSKAKKLVFVLTDGKSNRGVKPKTPASALKKRGVIIFAMGVTKNIRQRELKQIASSDDHIFHVTSYAVLNQVTSLLEGDLSKKCKHGQTVYDECGRRCKCQYGRLVKCCRLRKEFTDMSTAERAHYISVVKTAASTMPYKAEYDTLLTLHRTIFNSLIHDQDFFLPWHRWFILKYEDLLRKIDCKITVPYWDWSLVGADPFSSNFWDTGNHGFGGNGNPPGSCVTTGPFRNGVFQLVPSADTTCLTRDFNGEAPDAIAVQTLLETPAADFFDFESALRFVFHDEVHCIILGTMCTVDSASAPEFFLHHGFVDKIWADWQKKSNAHKYNEFFQNHASVMLSTPYRPRDFLDLSNQPGCVCAEYVDPQSTVFRSLTRLSGSQLRLIPRVKIPKLNQKAVRLFKITKAEQAQITRLRAKFQPQRSIRKSTLFGRDGQRGFKLTDVTAARKVSSGKA